MKFNNDDTKVLVSSKLFFEVANLVEEQQLIQCEHIERNLLVEMKQCIDEAVKSGIQSCESNDCLTKFKKRLNL